MFPINGLERFTQDPSASPPRAEPESWTRRAGRAFGVAVEASAVLVLVSCALAAFHYWRGGLENTLELAALLFVPVLASVILPLVAALVHDLVAPMRLAFPLNLTLPVVHTVFIIVIQAAVGAVGNVLEQPNELQRAVLYWARLDVLGKQLLFQGLVLTVLIALRPKSSDS
jgi:hypothetical protein